MRIIIIRNNKENIMFKQGYALINGELLYADKYLDDIYKSRDEIDAEKEYEKGVFEKLAEMNKTKDVRKVVKKVSPKKEAYHQVLFKLSVGISMVAVITSFSSVWGTPISTWGSLSAFLLGLAAMEVAMINAERIDQINKVNKRFITKNREYISDYEKKNKVLELEEVIKNTVDRQNVFSYMDDNYDKINDKLSLSFLKKYREELLKVKRHKEQQKYPKRVKLEPVKQLAKVNEGNNRRRS